MLICTQYSPIDWTDRLVDGTLFLQKDILRYLGSGASSIVYLLKSSMDDPMHNQSYALKMFKAGYEEDFKVETDVLSILQENSVENVLYAIDFSNFQDILDRRFFIIFPIGTPVIGSQGNDILINAINILENFYMLVSTIVKAYELGIVHRDIRPANILVRQKKIFLCDWGCAGRKNPMDIVGPCKSSSTSVLESIIQGKTFHNYSLNDELESLVKTWILIIYHYLGGNVMAQIKYASDSAASEVYDFWKENGLFLAILSYFEGDFSRNISKLENFLKVNNILRQ